MAPQGSDGAALEAAFTTSLLEAALGYADADFPVFPVHAPVKIGACDCREGANCTSPAKHPRTAQGFKDASLDELTIRRWWKEWPRANVAVAIPSGYTVLDIDGQAGLDALTEAGYAIPKTPTASTGKGWHHWFRTTTDLAPRANMLPKVDLRAPGSYVVAPPSLHVSGKQYRWQDSPQEVEFAPAPEWLVELATKPVAAGGGAETGHFDMAAVLAGVSEGRRDVELFRAAAKLRYADVPYEVALKIVADAAAQCVPPFPLSKAREKLDSAYGRYQPSVNFDAGKGAATLLGEDSVRVELQGAIGPVEFVFSDMEKMGSSLDAELQVRLLMPGTTDDNYVQRINLLSHSARDSCRRELESIFGSAEKGVWTKLLNRAASKAQEMYLGVDRSKRVRDIAAPAQVEYVVEGVIPEERPTVLFGAGSAAKTLLVMSMMLAVSRGAPWQGRGTQKRNCLLIDYETGEGTAGYRFGRLAAGLGLDEVPENIHHWWGNGIPLLDQIDSLRRCIATNNIGFVAIDHCGAACGTEPERAESALRFYRATAKLGVPVVAVAHITGDAEANPDVVRRPFGSVYWANGSSMTWYVRREDQEEGADEIEVGMFPRKCNDSARPPDMGLSITFDGKRGPITVETADLRESAELTASRGKEFVIREALDHAMTIADIAVATDLNTHTVKSTLRRHRGWFESFEPEAVGGRAKAQMWRLRASASASVTPPELPFQ